MKKFFYPKSLAVVGVSETPDNLARGIVTNLLQFNYQGKIFLVGARPGTAFDRPIFPSLRDLPEPVDLAVILAPARVIPALLTGLRGTGHLPGSGGVRRVFRNG